MMHKADFHTHTTFSDGKASVKQVIEAALLQRVNVLAITDHFDPNDFRHSISCLTEEALMDHFGQIRTLGHELGITVLCGVETTPLPSGTLDMSPALIQACDLIITSCHYIPYEGKIEPGVFFNDRYWEMYKESMIVMAAGPGDILGHCEDYLPIERFIEGLDTTYEERRAICLSIVEKYLDRAYMEKLAQALLSSGKICELHCATETPRRWVIEYLVSRKVRFSPGSDAHGLTHVGRTDWAYTVARETGANLCTSKEALRG